MGLLAGAMSFRRYRVLGALPDGFRDLYIESIGRFAFRENDRARSKEDNIGWVAITDAADIDLFLNKFLYNNFLVLSMRIDKKRVPGKYLKIQVDRKVRETMEARGLQRVGAAHKRELKEAVEEDLLARALPVVAVFDMAWDIHRNEVWFFGTSDLVNDHFRALFKDTFGLEIMRIQLSDWIMPPFSREELASLAEGLAPASFRP
jgi:recombination associated protein RdgC